MAKDTFPPFPVSKGDVLTGVIVQGGDLLRTITQGRVSFARVVGRTFDADGDDWSTPSDFPAPYLRKHSLIVKFGGGPWYQGGTFKMITVPPGESGEVVLRTNDHDDWLWDNDDFWQVTLERIRSDPPPPPPGPPQPDLRITSIEVVQAIQRAGNTVRLVQGKRTIVRVFVDSGLRNNQDVGAGPNRWPGVTGSLVITDATNGMTIANGIPPLNPRRVITAPAAGSIDREEWSHSLNFEFPIESLDQRSSQSLVDIRANVISNTPVSGQGGQATMSVRVAFRARMDQPLLPVLIELKNPAITAPAPSMSAFNAAVLSGAMPRYPVSETGFVVRPPFIWVTENDIRQDTHWNGLLQQLATIRLLSSTPVDGIRCGLLPDGPWPWGGKGAPRIWGSWVPAFVVQASDVVGFAHELGHTFGVWHSHCSGAEGNLDRRNLPGRIDDVGLNVHTRTVIPRLTPDLMSYCRNEGEQWCSVQFWEAIFNEGVI